MFSFVLFPGEGGGGIELSGNWELTSEGGGLTLGLGKTTSVLRITTWTGE